MVGDNQGFRVPPGGPFAPGGNFRRSAGDRSANLFFVDIDLSTARDKERIGMFGADFVSVDLQAWDDDTTPSTTKEVGIAVIHPGRKENPALVLKGGVGYEFGRFDAKDEFFITNTAQSNKMLRIYYSSGPMITFSSSDVQISGNVSTDPVVPDGETSNQRTFMGGHRSASGSTSAGIMLFNPAASGITAYVTKIAAFPFNGGELQLSHYSAAFTNNVTTLGNKTIGATAPACTMSQQGSPAAGTQIAETQATANEEIRFVEPADLPIALGESEGIAVRLVGNVTLSALFNWIEK